MPRRDNADFDSMWPAAGEDSRSSLAPIVIATLVSAALACLLLWLLLRLPLTSRWLSPIFLGSRSPVSIEYPHSPTPVESQAGGDITTLVVSSVSTVEPSGHASTVTSQLASPTPTIPEDQVQSSLQPPEIALLLAQMLDLINGYRTVSGLPPVSWDDTAASVGQWHAEDMLANNYFSHWNLHGYGPEHRYAFAGGRDIVFENIYTYWYRYDDGRPAPIEDWEQVIAEAQANLMDSPGHRRNILDPHHTHVGIGIAYDPAKGEMRLVQEFLNRYMIMQPIKQQAALGEKLVVQGELFPGVTQPVVNLTYQSLPQPFTSETVPTGAYQNQSQVYQAIEPILTGSNGFSAEVALDYDSQPGLYLIRIWVEVDGEQAPASELVVWVQ